MPRFLAPDDFGASVDQVDCLVCADIGIGHIRRLTVGVFPAQIHVTILALRFGRSEFARTPALDAQIRCVSALVHAGQRAATLDCELRNLIHACYVETWRQIDLGEGRCPSGQAIDFRVRKSMRLMQELLGADIELDAVARGAGLSRPHFYKLFRTQTGLTPNLYVNTLLMEHAIERLVASEIPVADIGYDLGFSSQSGFTRFFAANVGMAPTQYRRVAHVL